tara:strand:+ start:2880 stop:3425 length:546 start_codon:yes stop_codon:yes gene_type:complete
MNRSIYKYSFFYNAGKYIVKEYLRMEEEINMFYRQSVTWKVVNNAISTVKITFQHSLIGKLTESKESQSIAFLESSVVIQNVLEKWKRISEKIVAYTERSLIVDLVGALSKSFTSAPLKIGGVVLLISVTVNSILILFWGQEVAPFGWIMRGILFFLGITGLFSDVEWKELENGSMVLKKY